MQCKIVYQRSRATVLCDEADNCHEQSDVLKRRSVSNELKRKVTKDTNERPVKTVTREILQDPQVT